MRKPDLLWCAILFIAALIVRMSLFGFADYPIQAASSDASYHLVLIESGPQFGTLPPYIVQGRENIANAQPPLFYMLTYGLTNLFSGHYWNVAFFIICFASALQVVLVFILVKKVSRSQFAGGLAAAMLIMPIPFSTWMSYLSNGLWLSVLGQTILLFQILFILLFVKKPTFLSAFFLSLFTVIQVFTHLSETFIVLPIVFFAFLLVYKKQKNKAVMKYVLMFSISTIIALILYLPQILFVWLKMNPPSFGWHTVPNALPFLLKLAKSISLSNFPYTVLFFAFLGVCYLYYKKKYLILGIFLYLMGMAYLPLYVVSNAEYFIKLRYLFPAIIYMLASFGVLMLLTCLLKKRHHTPVVILLICLILGVSFFSFSQAKDRLYIPLTSQNWDALRWIDMNTNINSSIIFLNGFYEWNGLFSKRIGFEVDPVFLRSLQREGKITTLLNGTWMGHSHNLPEKRSWFRYIPQRNISRLNYLDDMQSINAFDFVVMSTGEFTDFNEGLLKKERSYSEVYSHHNIRIFKI